MTGVDRGYGAVFVKGWLRHGENVFKEWCFYLHCL